MISQRTKDALQAAKARGVKLGTRLLRRPVRKIWRRSCAHVQLSDRAAAAELARQGTVVSYMTINRARVRLGLTEAA